MKAIFLLASLVALPLMASEPVAGAGPVQALTPSGHDDFPALSAALETVAKAGGGTLELQTGTYRLSQPLVSPESNPGASLIRMVGQGPATVLTPLAPMPALVRITAGYFDLEEIRFEEAFDETKKPLADAAVLVDKPNNNLPVHLARNTFIRFPKAIEAWRGDAWQVRESFFNSNGTNFSLECRTDYILNVVVEGNQMLGGNGIDLPVPGARGTHVEGLMIAHNTILPATSGAFAVRIQAGLEIDLTNNILDQNAGDGVILDGGAAPIIYVKLVENWIGAGKVSHGSGLVILGGTTGSVRDVDVMGGTMVGFSEYGMKFDGSAGKIVDVVLNGLKFSAPPVTNGVGDLFAGDVVHLQLRDNSFGHPTNPLVESGATESVASGNVFAVTPHWNRLSRHRDNWGAGD